MMSILMATVITDKGMIILMAAIMIILFAVSIYNIEWRDKHKDF